MKEYLVLKPRIFNGVSKNKGALVKLTEIDAQTYAAQGVITDQKSQKPKAKTITNTGDK